MKQSLIIILFTFVLLGCNEPYEVLEKKFVASSPSAGDVY